MQFPNAAKGVKKLWLAEILSIIAVVLTVVMAIVFVVNFQNEISTIEQAAANGTEVALSTELTNTQQGALLATGGLALAVGIVGLIAFILGLVGSFQGRKDEVNFGYAFWIVVVGIVLSIVSSFLKIDQEFLKYIQIMADVCIAWMNYYVLLAVAQLAEKKGENTLRDSAKRASLWVAVAITASEVIQLFAEGIRNSNQTLMVVLMVVTGIVEIVSYVYYLIILSKAKTMLSAS